MNKYQEALEVCKGLYDYRGNKYIKPYEMDSYTLETIQELIDKQEKYRWHDLRKNPNDLPKEDGLYVVYENVYSWGYCDYNTYECVKEVKQWSDGKLHKPLAWKYIEEFEDE